MKTIDDYTIRDIRALINDRDALVAMNAELVEALSETFNRSCYDYGYGKDFISYVDDTLLKAKELSHETL